MRVSPAAWSALGWLAWLLVAVTLQAPSARPIVKHAGALAEPLAWTIPFAGAVLAALLLARGGDRIRAFAGRRPGLVGAVLGLGLAAALAVVVLVYPEADALRLQGRGSDQDDGVIIAARALLAGRDPYAVASYLGLPLSTGPGAVLAALPFVAAGWYGGVQLAGLSALGWALLRAGGPAAALAWLVLMASSVAVWEWLAQGSDLLWLGCLIAALAIAGPGWMTEPGGDGPARGRLVWIGVLAGLLGSARVVLAGLPLLLALAWWRGAGLRAAVAVAVAGTVAAGLLHFVFWLPGEGDYMPAHLLGKGRALFAGGEGTLAVVLALTGLLVLALVRCRAAPVLVAAAGLAPPLATAALVQLAQTGWSPSAWSGATWLALAAPGAAAAAALEATRQGGLRVDG